MAWVEKIKNGWRMVERKRIAGEMRRFTVPMENDTPECREDAARRLQERIGGAIKAPETVICPHFVYYIKDQTRNAVKIGFTKNPDDRLHSLQISNCDRLEMIRSIKFENRRIARTAEAFLHKTFQNEISTSMNEWFNDSIIDELKEHYWTEEQIMEVMK
jgi:hypothetical protein